MKTRHVLLAATLAAIAGGVAGLLVDRSPVLQSEAGQQALINVLNASAPAVPEGVAMAQRGQPLPEVPVRDLDGAVVDLRQAMAGRPTLVNVWATWCAPCLKEMPDLQAFSAGQGASGVQVLGVALDEADAVRAFVRSHGIEYPQWVDTPGAADAGVRLGNPRGVLPFSVLVDGRGTVRAMRVGPFASTAEIADWTADALP